MGSELSYSVVKGDFRAFQVTLSDIGPIYFTCNSGRSRADLVFCKLVPMNSEYMVKKELGVYLRVPGSSDQKTDSGRFGLHPNCISPTVGDLCIA